MLKIKILLIYIMTILSSRRANVNLNTGGGNKKQGLAPKATNFFIAPYTGNQYSVGSGDGRDRFRLVCMNQLGGIGRGRSQFGPSADGTNCPIDDLQKFRNYLFDINYYIQNTALAVAEIPPSTYSNYELCLVGDKESLLTDISNSNSVDYATISGEGFGLGSDHVIFTHLLSIGDTNTVDPLRITYNDGTSFKDKTLNVGAIQNKINFCNNFLKTFLRTSYLFDPTLPFLTQFGSHTLGLINNNIHFPSGIGPNATKFLQDSSGGYGNTQLFSYNTPIPPNNINIFLPETFGYIQITLTNTHNISGISINLFWPYTVTKLNWSPYFAIYAGSNLRVFSNTRFTFTIPLKTNPNNPDTVSADARPPDTVVSATVINDYKKDYENKTYWQRIIELSPNSTLSDINWFKTNLLNNTKPYFFNHNKTVYRYSIDEEKFVKYNGH